MILDSYLEKCWCSGNGWREDDVYIGLFSCHRQNYWKRLLAVFIGQFFKFRFFQNVLVFSGQECKNREKMGLAFGLKLYLS